ncbi:hypothetical protein KCU81_g3908, partial [Aureobasidium melanogenum]|uniref:Uncharacterized protein n=1 Tax=Aureobasidium melanogenum (strain CBS 110374) TaxID=1043003 RepID=A0A074VTG5_AURM1
MARLTDLPPEIKLHIYQLLLVDPIRDRLRIALTFDPLDNKKKTWSRARCTQTEQPHNEGHSTAPCCVDVQPFTLHHLDFTDLWSLARASKMLYVEATKTIYNNADLVYSSGEILPVAKSLKHTVAFSPLTRFLGSHSPTTCSMLTSLVINDKSAAMTPRDMKLIVDLVNIRLPNIRVLGYQVGTTTATSLTDLLRDTYLSIAGIIKVVQPFACLKSGIRTFVEVPISTELATLQPQLYHSLCHMRHHIYAYASRIISRMVRLRRIAHKHHALALQRGDYLLITVPLRSTPIVEAQVSKTTNGIEEMLNVFHDHGWVEMSHREMREHARAPI